MNINEKRLRFDYDGEFVITKTVMSKGEKTQTREWVDNPITNTSLNHRACCIGNGFSTKKFPMRRLGEHPGGLLGKDKMQLYGTEECWQKLTSDFLIVFSPDRLKEIITADYQVDNIIYTSGTQCIANPGEFYLIPYGMQGTPTVVAAWLACFDGHKDVYLFGYDRYSEEGVEQTKMINGVSQVIKVYSDVTFHFVTDIPAPDEWRQHINFNILTTREFVSYCDI